MSERNNTFETNYISYFDRIKIDFMYIIVICIIILSLFHKNNDMYFIIFLPLLILLIYGFEISIWNKYYITKIIIYENYTELCYYQYDKLSKLIVPNSQLKLEVRYIWYKVRSPHSYLRISNGGSQVINQHIGYFWDKNKFETLINVIKKKENFNL